MAADRGSRRGRAGIGGVRLSRPAFPYSGSPHTGCPIARSARGSGGCGRCPGATRAAKVRGRRRSSVKWCAPRDWPYPADGHARAYARVAPDRRLDRPRARRRAPLDERQVLALDQPLAQSGLQQPMGLPPSGRRRAAPRCRGRADARSPRARPRRPRRCRRAVGRACPRGARERGARRARGGLSTTSRCSSW